MVYGYSANEITWLLLVAGFKYVFDVQFHLGIVPPDDFCGLETTHPAKSKGLPGVH
jgi:hypothetical protein